ncbi:MAG: hypothetical protein WBZ20_00350 [Nitrososphaeraceae archaeon]
MTLDATTKGALEQIVDNAVLATSTLQKIEWNSSMSHEWKTIQSGLIFQNPWIELYQG